MDSYDILNKRRIGFKARIIDFNEYITEVRGKELSSSQEIVLKLRIMKVESMFQQYEKLQSQLESNGYLKMDKTALQSYSKFESNFYESLAISKDLLCKKNNNNYTETSSSDKSTQTSNLNPLQFPMIQLPKFNGCYSNWLEFRETFINLIHSNDLINDIEKFRYLLTSMEDSAAVLIQTVDFSANNYAFAWKLINERYNNIYMLVKHHLSCLFNIKAIEKRSSITLKGFINQLQKNLRALELLGEPVKHWDILLLHIFTPKLDENTRREWEDYSLSRDDSSMTLDVFLQFLRTRTDLIEASEITESKDSIF